MSGSKIGGGAPYRIALVCLGNICRSPMADVVLSAHLADAELSDHVSVDSFGTGGWHQGDQMDRRANATLRAAGYDGSNHRARQITEDQLVEFDLILAMDSANLRELHSMVHPPVGPVGTIRLFRDFDPDSNPTGSGADVPDPYYGGVDGFEEVLSMVERTSAEIVARFTAGELAGGPG
jgi:protein-tyrosine phosphatase